MKKSNKGVVGVVTAIAEPLVTSLGYFLWDVEYVKEGADMYLRITIDSEEGINIEDCEKVHRAIDPLLDEADPIPGSYTFEVSSAGLDRALRREEHFAACMGQTVDVKLYRAVDGRKEHTGQLQAWADGAATVDGRTFEKKDVAQVRLHVTF